MLCLLSAFSLCACRVACKYGSISRFKGVFRGFYGVRVGLCCLGALRGLCGFLCACGVRRLKDLLRVCLPFILLYLSFVLFLVIFLVLLLLCLPYFLSFSLSLCCCCPLLVLSLWLVVSFSLSVYTQKERAQSVIPCVLASCVVGCFILLLLCIPRIHRVSARLYRNKVLRKGNLTECSKLFCARLCSCLCNSKFVFLLFPYILLLVGSYFLFPFGYMFSASLIVASFDFENIHPAPQVR